MVATVKNCAACPLATASAATPFSSDATRSSSTPVVGCIMRGLTDQAIARRSCQLLIGRHGLNHAACWINDSGQSIVRRANQKPPVLHGPHARNRQVL